MGKIIISDKNGSMTLKVFSQVAEEYKMIDVSDKTVSQQLRIINQITEFLNLNVKK